MTVRANPQAVFALVLDLQRYRQADHKIRRVGEVRRSGDVGTVTFSGQMRGLPGPRGTYPFSVDGTCLTIGSPIAGAVRWFLGFEGSFRCSPSGDGAVVTHRESFKRPWHGIADPLLRTWLQADVADEVERIKALLEGDGLAI